MNIFWEDIIKLILITLIAVLFGYNRKKKQTGWG